MGNGYPVAGLVVRPEVLAAFGAKARYFNTFGGNAVAAATASAVLEVIEEEGLLANARVTGTYLAAGLRDLAARHDCIGEVRGAGLFIGADILREGKADAGLAGQVVNGLREARVLISATGAAGNVLKIRPPLVFTREHADIFLDRIGRIVATL
jgi:4-aminobutyrate aminotransferase-like enzyme